MSHENVEIVQSYVGRLLGEVAPEDMPRLIAQVWDPDGDYYPVRKFPEARACHGRDEIARFLAEFKDAWDRYEVAISEAFAVTDDRVLICGTIHAEGRESGVELDGKLHWCAWLRSGRIFRMEDHLTLPGALNALGLSGETLEAAGLSE